MKLRPISDNIVVRPQEAATQTASGLYIATAEQKGVTQGVVLSTGPGKHDDSGKFISVDIEPGSTVLFNTASGTSVKVEDEEVLVITESEIIGVVKV